MNKRCIFWLLLITLAALFVFGCGKSDDDNNNNPLIIDDPNSITSEVADWLIVFMPVDGLKGSNSIMVTYLKDTGAPLPTDIVELFINGVSVPIPSFMEVPGFYIGSYDLTQGTTYQVQFEINGVQKVNTNLRMVTNVTNFSTPQYYAISQPTPISWTLASSNQHQYAGVSGYKDNYPAEPTEDEYFVELPVSARDYTIPANAVDNLGTGAEYNLGVTQVNYGISSRVACMSFHDAFSTYGGITKSMEPMEIYLKALALHKALNKK